MQRTALFLSIVGVCVALSDNGADDVSIFDKEFNAEFSVVRSPYKCLEGVSACLSRRFCYSRAKDLDIACCKSSFAADGKFNKSAEKECMGDKISPDVEDCVTELDISCVFALKRFFDEKEEKYDELQESIKSEVTEPSSKYDCKRYSDEIEEIEWNRCKENSDEDFVWLCNIIENVMKDSPLAKRNCIQDFGECVVETLTEPKVEDICISCCKESVWNKTDYYKLKEKCSKKQIGPFFKDCLESSPKYCFPEIVQRFMEDKDAIVKFNERVQDIVGVPPSMLYCKSYYNKSVKQMLGMCKLNEDKKLDFYCDISQRILQHFTERQENRYGYIYDENNALADKY